jgi:antitoxin component YwqK of YwqJK toxin-antitoxin module
VWEEGLEGWKPASSVKGLFAAQPQPPHTSPSWGILFKPTLTWAIGSWNRLSTKALTWAKSQWSRLSTKAKWGVVGAAVAVPLALILVLVMAGKSPRPAQSEVAQQGGDEREVNRQATNREAKQRDLKQREMKVRLPDFTLPDFTKLDYSKGPNGQKLEPRTIEEKCGYRTLASGFTENGDFVRHGLVRTVFPSGEKAEGMWFFNGKAHGHEKGWYKDGNLLSEGTNVDGWPHGRFTYWHQNGKKAEEVVFLHGLGEGTYRAWYPSGAIYMECEYQKGEETDRKRWYGDGSKLEVREHGGDGVTVTLYYPPPYNDQPSQITVSNELHMISRTEFNHKGVVCNGQILNPDGSYRSLYNALNCLPAPTPTTRESADDKAFRNRNQDLLMLIGQQRFAWLNANRNRN